MVIPTFFPFFHKYLKDMEDVNFIKIRDIIDSFDSEHSQSTWINLAYNYLEYSGYTVYTYGTYKKICHPLEKNSEDIVLMFTKDGTNFKGYSLSWNRNIGSTKKLYRFYYNRLKERSGWNNVNHDSWIERSWIATPIKIGGTYDYPTCRESEYTMFWYDYSTVLPMDNKFIEYLSIKYSLMGNCIKYVTLNKNKFLEKELKLLNRDIKKLI